MRAFRKWATKRNRTREALLGHFAEAIVCLEQGRASATPDAVRGDLQELVSEVQALRTKLEIMPEEKLAGTATLRDLEDLDDAVEAVTAAESESKQAAGLRAAREAVARLAIQFA